MHNFIQNVQAKLLLTLPCVCCIINLLGLKNLKTKRLENFIHVKFKRVWTGLFTLEDEEGNEQTFELVDVYKEDDITYYALIPQQSDPDNLEEDDYFVTLKKDDNDGDEYLSSVDDENELDRLAEIFMERIFVEEDCDCDDENCDCCH